MKITIEKITINNFTLENVVIECDNDFNLSTFLNEIVIEEPIEEPIEELIEEPIQLIIKPDIYDFTKELLNENIQNLDSIINKFKNNKFSKSTLSSYTCCIKKILAHFPNEDLNDLFYCNLNELINKCYSMFDNMSTIKSYLTSIQNVLKLFNFPAYHLNLIGKHLLSLKKLILIKNDSKQKKEVQPIENAEQIVNVLVEKYNEYNEKLTDDVYDFNRQMAAYTFFSTHYGILRPGELMDIMICDNDENQYANYFNLSSQKLIIKEHKTKGKYGTKIIDLSIEPDFIELLKPGIGLHFISNLNREPYKTSSGLSDMVKKYLKFDVYTFRKAMTSVVLSTEKINLIDNLAYVQGHSVETQCKSYNCYI
jgi:hypothetical protein